MGVADFKLALLALALGACTSVAVDQRTFEGTRWRVTAVNDQATPQNGDYHLRFSKGEIGARFSCNSIGGKFTVSGETLITRDMSSTLMGCPEPSASLENAGLRVLSQPMRWTAVAGTRLTLHNNAGSIALERMP
jgi:heat shock protein HslJ